MIDLLNHHRNEIAHACRLYGVRRLDVFGSAAGGNYVRGKSDIDFLVDFEVDPGRGSLLSRYMDFAEQLEHLLGTRVDILTPQSIRNPYIRNSIEKNRECIYAA